VEVHPYEEAQGFQRLLDLPGYDVTAIAAKSDKSASHIYARLSLLQLIPEVAEAFVQERITASHANLIARLPQENQAAAFENCWRKDWQDKEAHLLPAKYLSAWIQANLYLNLAEAPFDREDISLKPEAGACVATLERIIEHAPASFGVAQMRVFLRLVIQLDHSFLEDVVTHFANGDENEQRTDEDVVLAALDSTADEKLTGFALRLVLPDHLAIPCEGQPDLLTEA
jgi:ParB family chromosome partitioning protein